MISWQKSSCSREYSTWAAAIFAPAHVEYSREQDDFCQEIMLQSAAHLLRKNPSMYIFMDGRTFSQRYQRERVFDYCSELAVRWMILECVCSEPIAIARLEKDAAERCHPARNRTPELYLRVRDAWQPIDDPKLIIDTETSLNSCVERATQYLVSLRDGQMG